MHVSQLIGGGVILREAETACLLPGLASVYDLALAALAAGRPLAAEIAAAGKGEAVDLPALAAEGRLDMPMRHPEPARMYLTGTGLTHTGSAATRDAMHSANSGEEKGLSDSMKMFRIGLEGGKPAAGKAGAQPEWFYKGPGSQAVGPGQPLVSPGFALDGGEEPEIAGFYLIDDQGRPARVGWSLANEFSDHVTERINYLYLAHSKLRPAAFGPEMLIGALPQDIRGTSRILRDGAVIWEKPFLSGEANMSHSFANLEHHHFKYAAFRRPGDLHVHMFGTATLSFADGVRARPGDVFEISSETFGLPLANPLAAGPEGAEDLFTVRSL